jgi:hypothetical protein
MTAGTALVAVAVALDPVIKQMDRPSPAFGGDASDDADVVPMSPASRVDVPAERDL